jgi:ABC-type antimicrobial peptide transport system permease subunit
VRQWGPEQPVVSHAYFPLTQGWTTGEYLTARTSGDPDALVAEIRKAVLAVDPQAPPSDVRTMSDLVDRTLAQRRFYTTLVALFAAAALFLAAAGIYGTVSYFVARRTRELAIRIVLGAKGNGIMSLVVKRAVRLAVWGVLLGLVGVWASTRVVRGLVFGLSALDPLTILAGCVVLAFVAIAAAALPARRAVRLSPVLALKTE